MITYWLDSESIRERVLIPKFYNPEIENDLAVLKSTHLLFSVKHLVDHGFLSLNTGHEIGKIAYGTGNIPFVRTSDISNWEIKSAPKQGVSDEIYETYRDKQDVKPGDIFIVRDGTYLIGTNCIVTELDQKVLYQSHIIKVRINNDFVDPYIIFLAINTDLVQRQIRSFQFTADTIDTIGNRFLDVIIPIPRDEIFSKVIGKSAKDAMIKRVMGKAFIKQAPVIIEEVLKTGQTTAIDDFFNHSLDDILEYITQDTVTSEFGRFETFWIEHNKLMDRILLPKYYDPDVSSELAALSKTCDCVSISELIERGILEATTGIEIGKMAYGTGHIPFIRTSDFSNWELKHDPKQGVSQEIYDEYKSKQDVRVGDILIVRDGTYLVGTSCIVTEADQEILFCGGLYKIRVIENDLIDNWLLLGLLNSYIVKRQIRTKQFTRDVIDTIGKRLEEIVLPIPRSSSVKFQLSSKIQSIVEGRILGRQTISKLVNVIESPNYMDFIKDLDGL